jgi:CubicO group peptidase (beta-lactamase class C family)
VADGLLRLDDPVVDYFPEVRAKLTHRRAQAILVRHLASMSTGHTEDTTGPVFTTSPEDPVLRHWLQRRHAGARHLRMSPAL